MVQKITSAAIIFIGLAIMIFPMFTGKKAYFAKDNFYINMVDSVDIGYNPYISKIIVSKRAKLAFKEKKQIREKFKLVGDSLERVLINAQLKNKKEIVESVNKEKGNLSSKVLETEFAIDEKYSVENLSEQQIEEYTKNIKDSISPDDYLVIIANELYNPNKLKSIPKLTREDINVKVVNKQDKGPFLISGFFILITGLVVLLYSLQLIPLHIRSAKYGVILLFLVLGIIMTNNIYHSISDRLEFENSLAKRTKIVKAKLGDIRSLQMAYLESNQKYCASWDSLILFAKNDSIEIVKYLVNKDDTMAVNKAKRAGLPLEKITFVPVVEKVFNGKAPFNMDSMGIVPFSNQEFDINAGSIDKNGREIQVFEVKTTLYSFVKNLPTLPANFDKSKQLILGSMQEPSTEGNW